MELGGDTRTPLLTEDSAGGQPYIGIGDSRLIHDLIAEQAAFNPSAVAVEFDQTGRYLTYGELAARSDTVAEAIRAATAGKNDQPFAAINVDRSLAMLVGQVGILKSGSAYVPIDPVYPLDRQEYIFEDSKSDVLVTMMAQSDAQVVKVALDKGLVVICLDEQGNLVKTLGDTSGAAKDGIAMTESQKPDSLAYILYTSGSTGKPKGVMVMHKNVVNMLQHFRDAKEFDQEN